MYGWAGEIRGYCRAGGSQKSSTGNQWKGLRASGGSVENGRRENDCPYVLM